MEDKKKMRIINKDLRKFSLFWTSFCFIEDKAFTYIAWQNLFKQKNIFWGL